MTKLTHCRVFHKTRIEFNLPYYDAEMSIKNGYLSTYGLPEADEKKKSPIQAIFRVIFLLVLLRVFHSEFLTIRNRLPNFIITEFYLIRKLKMCLWTENKSFGHFLLCVRSWLVAI